MVYFLGSAKELEKQLGPLERKNSPKKNPLTQQMNQHFDVTSKKPNSNNIDRGKERQPRHREIPGATADGDPRNSSESQPECTELVTNDVEVRRVAANFF